jgi:formate dehydrogenase subunit delta
MANQIAANFDYGSDRTRAIAGVLDHLTRFWTPEMKRAIVEYARSGNAGLNIVAAEAVAELGERYGATA